MKLKPVILLFLLGSFLSSCAYAETSGETFACASGLECPFSFMKMETIGGVRYLNAKRGDYEFMAQFTSSAEAEGAIQVSYGGVKCAFPISIRLEKVAKGYKVVSQQAPIPDSIRWQCPPASAKVLKVHPHTYLSEEARNKIVTVESIVLLDQENKNPNKALGGTWRIDKRFGNLCSDEDHVDMLQFNCDAPTGPQVQISRRPIESKKECFNPDPKLPIDPLVAVKFKSVGECQTMIASLRDNLKKNLTCIPGYVCPIYTIEWGFTALKSTGVILTSEQLSTGNF